MATYTLWTSTGEQTVLSERVAKRIMAQVPGRQSTMGERQKNFVVTRGNDREDGGSPYTVVDGISLWNGDVIVIEENYD